MTEEASARAKETAKDLKQTAQDWGQKAKGKARDIGAAADMYVHEYTWSTVATVAVVAGLIGFLVGRRQS